MAFLNEDDVHHGDAQRIFADCLGGRDPRFVTSDYILDEAATLIKRRTRRHEMAVKVIRMITESDWVTFEFVEEDTVEEAKDRYIKYDDKDLSFTDWVSVVHMDKKDYDGIVSFDEDFDGVGVNRIY